jgi:cytochrome c biogenesis protein CcmG, thiol:disulfide interchange protein DsbE
MKKIPLVLAAVLGLAFAGAALWHRSGPSGANRPAAQDVPAIPADSGGRSAPPFTLYDIHGNRVSSEQFLGKPTVINFFATWCPSCREETPGFVEVYNKYRTRGLELVGISLDTDTKGSLPTYVMSNRIEYRILIGDLFTARAYGGVSSIPTTFFVGKDGEIKNVHVGYIDKKAFEEEVRKIL